MTRNGVCSLTSTAVDERVEHQPHKGAFSETTTNCVHHVCKVSLTNCRPKVTSNVVLSSLSRRCPPSNGNKPSPHNVPVERKKYPAQFQLPGHFVTLYPCVISLLWSYPGVFEWQKMVLFQFSVGNLCISRFARTRIANEPRL